MNLADIEELYRTHGPAVLRRARALLGNEEAARDAMQQVFIKAIDSSSSFRGDSSPATWLYRMTTNFCLNVIRDSSRRRELLAEHGSVDTTRTGISPEERATLVKVLDEVPDELREIAIYYYVDQMNQDEIASIIGVSRRTVGNRLDAFRSAAKKIVGEVETSDE